MALINGIFVWVKDEAMTNDAEGTTHPVEKGIDLTDHTRAKPWELSLTGKIVGDDAADTLSKILAMKDKGVLVEYLGRNTAKNGQIITFHHSHPNTVWGGMEFDMTIRQVRIAQSSYNATTTNKNAGEQQVENNTGKQKRYYTVKKGDCRWSIAEQYKDKGVTIDSLTKDNGSNGDLFASGKANDWMGLKVGAQIYLGEW